jgi:hypothetical protein
VNDPRENKLVNRKRYSKRDSNRVSRKLTSSNLASNNLVKVVNSKKGSSHNKAANSNKVNNRGNSNVGNRDFAAMISNKSQAKGPTTTLVQACWVAEEGSIAIGAMQLRLLAKTSAFGRIVCAM